MANCDGERDPRNVLALCRLWRELPKAFNEAEEDVVDAADSTTTTTSAQAFVANCEEVYDVVAAYFPISFKPQLAIPMLSCKIHVLEKLRQICSFCICSLFIVKYCFLILLSCNFY